MTVTFARWLSSIVVCAMAIGGLASCSRSVCGDEAPGTARDACHYEQIRALGPDQVNQVDTLARQIEDSVVRSAAVDYWLRDHRAEVAREDGKALCELLEAGAAGRCLRSFSAAHLQP